MAEMGFLEKQEERLMSLLEMHERSAKSLREEISIIQKKGNCCKDIMVVSQMKPLRIAWHPSLVKGGIPLRKQRSGSACPYLMSGGAC